MKPPVPYYGGKSRIADWIAALFPPHRVYAEPFAGSAAVLFAKEPSVHEILNDLDGNVVHFYRVLRDHPDDLERACALTPYARAEFDQADASEPGIDDIERARRWYARLSQSFAKTGSHATGWHSSINRGSNNARTVQNRIGRFAGVAERLATVTLEHRDALAVIAQYSAPDGVIYCDPPYLDVTRSAHASGKRPLGDYACEFATTADHEALADALHASASTVFVSGYASTLYEDLYAGWWRTERTVVRGTAAARGNRMPHVDEVIWSNRELAAPARLFEVSR